MINQDLPHRLGCHPKKVLSFAGKNGWMALELEKRFVHKRGRLERVPRSLRGETHLSNSAELGVDLCGQILLRPPL